MMRGLLDREQWDIEPYVLGHQDLLAAHHSFLASPHRQHRPTRVIFTDLGVVLCGGYSLSRRSPVIKSSVVDRTAPINPRQREILQWIADGCPEGVMKDYTYKTTAVALQGRRLVTVSRKGGVWYAVTTEAGEHYLRHGTYPDAGNARDRTAVVPVSVNASPEAGGASPARSRRAATHVSRSPGVPTFDERADNLVVQVIQAGGVLQIDAQDDDTDYKGLCKAAKKAPNLPFGKQLRVRSTGPWWADEFEIYFDEDFAARVFALPVPIPQRVVTYHPVVAAYRADSDHHEVSNGSLGRAIRILQALAGEAVRRGYTVKTSGQHANQHGCARVRRLTDGQLCVVIDGFAYQLRIREQSGKGGEPLRYGPQRDRLPLWKRARQAQFVPTGELRITIDEGYGRDGRQAEFRDTKRATLEERLPDVLRELQIRAAEDNWRRQEEQRRAEEKRRRWERAMDQAQRDFREAKLAEALRAQVADWRLSRELDAYLEAMEAAIPSIVGEKKQTAAAEWLSWAKEYRRNIDPLTKPLAKPTVPKPDPDGLKPFLRGWSPYGPGSN
jgi:hypothetical protein